MLQTLPSSLTKGQIFFISLCCSDKQLKISLRALTGGFMTLANFCHLLLVLEQANLELTSFLLNVGVLFLQGGPIFTFFS
jgi:hypothetical protein